jgi:hypothetical protein
MVDAERDGATDPGRGYVSPMTKQVAIRRLVTRDA